jgi:hypothetical protein
MFTPIIPVSAWRCGALALVSLLPLAAHAQFAQDFTSSSTVGDYASATPDNGQFNAIGGGGGVTWSISSGALQLARTSTGAAWLDRTTDLGGAPLSALALSFDFRAVDITASGATANSLVFYVGDGLTSSGTVPGAGTVHSQFAINLNNATTDTWFLRNVGTATNSANSGTTSFLRVTFVVNNTGSALNYDVGGLSGTLANDTFDLWLGTTRQFAGGAATDGGVALAEFKMRMGNQTGTLQFDNFSVTAIPEPSTWAALFGIAALGVVMIRRRSRQSA